MWVTEQKLYVLDAIACNVSSVHQRTRTARVLEWLREDVPPYKAEHFEGHLGEANFIKLVGELEAEGLLVQEPHRKTGEPLLGLTVDAVKVEGLDVSCLL